MNKIVQLYVEGRSDQLFFEGSNFREFVKSQGFSIKVKNLRTKGNVLVNFEKFLRLDNNKSFAKILIYDKDCKNFDTSKIEAIIKSYDKTFHHIAIQEIEAWFIADYNEIKKINSNHSILKDTMGIVDPKRWLKELFYKAEKGFKTEMDFAQHFSSKINFIEARKYNKSLDRFLNLFETKFEKAA